MDYFKYVLNLPWTACAIILSLLSVPIHLNFNKNAIVIHVQSFWWHPSKGVRAITLGNVILLGSNLLRNDLNHELIHIEQHMREPFIHPFLAAMQLAKNGAKNSKYEREAYERAGNKFIER